MPSFSLIFARLRKAQNKLTDPAKLKRVVSLTIAPRSLKGAQNSMDLNC